MDKIDFIYWLLNHFDVSDFIFEREIDKYTNGLLKDIDYLKLQTHIEKYSAHRPSVIELNKIAVTNKFFVKQEEIKSPALRHIAYLKATRMKGTMKDLDDDLKDKIRAFLSKYGKTPSFDL